jgi:hypothetical protein
LHDVFLLPFQYDELAPSTTKFSDYSVDTTEEFQTFWLWRMNAKSPNELAHWGFLSIDGIATTA